MARSKNTKPVYSTESGKLCPDCGAPSAKCVCKQQKAAPQGDGIIRLHRQTKGRNGKPVTLVKGLPLAMADLQKLAKRLKQICGVGGTIEGHEILIQGDKRDTIKTELEKLGYTVKLAGG